MRRIKWFLAAVAVMAAMLAASPGSAMADVDFDDGFFFGEDFFDEDFFDFGGDGVTLDVSNEAESGGVSLGFSVN